MTKTLTQTQIENLSTEEYCLFLSMGDEILHDPAHASVEEVALDTSLQKLIAIIV
jgi:hypothetical protein